jgi:nitrous oxide reductase accessory protein NosL
MKKFIPYIVVGVLVLIIVTVFLSLAKVQHMVVIKEGNLKKLPLKMELHKYQDSYCGMVIDELDYASQVVAPDGRTWFFHDHGDFVQWLENKDFKDEAVIWVMSRDTHKWIDGRKAYYSLDEITPMGYGFGAYEQKGEGMVDFETMRLKMLRGETLKNPKIRKQILGK